MPKREGSIHLFRLFGIDVFLSYYWFLAAAYFVSQANVYSSIIFSIGESLGMFFIVLLHEFGHAFACRSVGGKASEILLLPLGGATITRPPPRPAPKLWTVAAGPLVNLILVPILTGSWLVASHMDWDLTAPDTLKLLYHVQFINIVLLCFNLLPIYPMDGGQILQSLLWFFVNRAKSLLIASVIGFIGAGGLVLLAVAFWLNPNSQYGSIYNVIVAVFLVMSCISGLRTAWALGQIEKMPKREGFACPSCKQPPPIGDIWRCGKCGTPFDIFAAQSICPYCGTQNLAAPCLDCGNSASVTDWQVNRATTPPGDGTGTS